MKYLHTMIRVINLDKSLRFYCEGLGFKLVSRRDYEVDRFTLAFLCAPGDTDNGAMIELTHNWDTTSYTRGDGYGHMAYQVASIGDVQKKLKAAGFDLSWGPGQTPDGRQAMAFADDPDGYEIELLQGV